MTVTRPCASGSCCPGTRARRPPGRRRRVCWSGGPTGSGSTRRWSSPCPTAALPRRALSRGPGARPWPRPCWPTAASPSAMAGRWRWITTSGTGSTTCSTPYPRWRRRPDTRANSDTRRHHRLHHRHPPRPLPR